MAKVTRPTPDEFQSPQPHTAAGKSVFNKVITRLFAGGNAAISLMTGLLASVLILYSGYVLYDSFYTQNAAASTAVDLLAYRPEIIEDGASPMSGAETLAEINEDYRAWLTLYESTIDYPVVQGPDDLYYASHDIYGNSSLTGAIYLAAANTWNYTDSYNLIYGHHMDNGAMFGALDRFEDAEYFRNHREGILVAETGIYDLYTFAVIRTDAYENQVYTVGNRAEEVLSFLRAPDEKTTVVIFDEAVASNTYKIVALSTCASADTNGRLLVFARMTRRETLSVTAYGYSGAYDTYEHYGTAVPSVTEGTTLEYSVDDGATWSSEPPSIRNVGTIRFRVRAHNDELGDATAYAVLTVTPLPVTVTADPAQEIYDSGSHAYTATVSGVIDDYEIEYAVENTLLAAGGDAVPDVGHYAGVIVPSGTEVQGNYIVSYYPGDLDIEPSSALSVEATGYEGVYDAASHSASATGTEVRGTTVIEYSTDGGETWSSDPASILDVGETEVEVRATNPNYVTAYDTATLIVTPRPAVVTAAPASKEYGAADPAFTATVSGVIDDYALVYTLSRVGNDEEAGTYAGVIVPAGEALQGNYSVTYVPADFTITRSGELTISASGYTGVYDGNSHYASATTNVTEGTVIEYSTDGGATWSTEAPGIVNVGSETVLVRATNPGYETVQTTVTLTVTPAAVTVTAHDAVKNFGDPDPAFSAEVTGLIGNDSIAYTVARVGNDEAVGSYPGVIVPSGAAYQGNYVVTYVPAELRIEPGAGLTVTAEGYTGMYDTLEHAGSAGTNVTEGTVIEYSTDGGVTWTETPPVIRDVGELRFEVRATNENYLPAYAGGVLQVTPAPVIVTAQDSGKQYGAADPVFSATVSGVLDDYEIRYSVERQGGDEAVGYYRGVIVPAGEALQGNYSVTYVPANFTISSTGYLTLTATGYRGVYDAQAHTGSAAVNVAEGTVIEYSTDGGETWLTEMPSITNVGSIPVLVRATNPNYEPVTQTVALTVTPAEVVVRARAAEKTAGQADPVFEATVTGVIDGYTIEYTVSRPGAGRDEAAGRYPNAIVPGGSAEQGNYRVRYIPADFTIREAEVPVRSLTVTATGYEGVYDARAHEGYGFASIAEALVEYSTDGGATWSTERPSITNVGELEFMVRASYAGYEPAEARAVLRVTPRDVTVLAAAAVTVVGQADPEFTAQVSGVIDGYAIEYTVSRPGAGRDEAAGTYPNAIVPAGAEEQGNYLVRYVPANFVIAEDPSVTPVIPVGPTEPTGPDGPTGPTEPTEPAGPEEPTEPRTPQEEEIGEPDVPLIRLLTELFDPVPYQGHAAWALVNLICLILTIYLCIPLLHLKGKFGRGNLMKQLNGLKEALREAEELQPEEEEERERIERTALEEREKKAASGAEVPTGPATEEEFNEAVYTLYYRFKQFLRKFWIGFGFEIIVSALALLVFILTEDMRLPMILIDRWTLLMVLFLLICWLLDLFLIRYRKKVLAEEDEEKEPEASEATAGEKTEMK